MLFTIVSADALIAFVTDAFVPFDSVFIALKLFVVVSSVLCGNPYDAAHAEESIIPV
jgi:hypothetical protein